MAGIKKYVAYLASRLKKRGHEDLTGAVTDDLNADSISKPRGG